MSKERQIPPEFVVTIPVRNEAGQVVGEKQFVVYAGLLALAHELGLERISTEIVQMPDETNGMTAVLRAVVQGRRGAFSGVGDASPSNVNRKVVRHLIRVAETRAKARALRDYANVGLVALEELGDEEAEAVDSRPSNVARLPARGPQPMSDAQRRALWRKALNLGFEGRDAFAFLSERLGCDPNEATREQASRLLDALSREERSGGDRAAE